MSDRKGYNGLRGPVAFGGQVHDLGANRQNQQAAVQQAFAAQLQVLMREMYVRAAADWMVNCDDYPSAGDYGMLAQQCQIAALSYFEGLGLIQAKPPEEPKPAEQAS